jgi:hypothetical protein
MEESEEVPVPIEEALPGMQIVSLPAGCSWVGALILVKLGGRLDSHGRWDVPKDSQMRSCLARLWF